MSLNLTNDEKEKSLSATARRKAAELQKQIQELFQVDANREPKLNAEEKAQVTKLEADNATIKPVMEVLKAQHSEGTARLKELTSFCNLDGILSGQDIDKLVDEIAHLERVLPIKFDAIVRADVTLQQNEVKIGKIKHAARVREATHE